MNRFTEIRVRLLAAIAIGLATALIVHAVTRDSNPVLDSLWRYARPGSDDGSVVALSGDPPLDSSDDPAASGASKPAPKRSGALLIDGGDYTGPDDTPNPAVSPSVTPAPTADLDGAEDSTGQQASGGMGVNIPPVGSPTASGQDDFMVGGWTRKGGGYGPSTPTSDPSASDWVGGQPRGYAMLYALQPEARPVVEGNVVALLAARVREPFIGVLVDGTFGKDFGYLRELIQRLNTDGRNLHLALYLANGPAQRRFRNPLYEAPFVKTSPEDFRREIRRSNSDAQVQYLTILADARRLFEYNILTNPDAKNYAVVMLEDNLDRDSFRAMSTLAREQVGAVATIVRNPCKGCYDGNDDDSLGYPREDHIATRFGLLQPGDSFTLDGQSFLYPSEISSGGKAVSAEQLVSLLRSSYSQGLAYFGLWRETWQGVVDGGPLVEPKLRTYRPSTGEEINFESQALRTGLPLVNSDDTVQADEESTQLFSQMGGQ